MKMTDKRQKIIIFSGTTEGRELSERLIKNKVPHTVCVATQYGEMMCTEDEHVLIREGRLNADEMTELFSQGTEIVLDATHPFATEVSQNIRRAAENNNVRFVRVLRENGEKTGYAESVRSFDSLSDCVKKLNETPGNILFTTGSKDLNSIVSFIDDISRVYVRVLPSVSAIEACEKAGIRNDHIIAMHGPFSEELNVSVIKQFDIACLVTKESGRTGGTDEKISACERTGIPCFLIKRPVEDSGIGVEDAFSLVFRYFEQTSEEAGRDKILESEPAHMVESTLASTDNVSDRKKTIIHFDLVGTGMGDPSGLTGSADSAVKSADILFGASRLIDAVEHKNKYPYYLASDIIKSVLSQTDKIMNTDGIKIAVMFSGDVGFYSGANGFEEKCFADERLSEYALEFTRYPGISSVSAFAAKLGIDYTDALILSLHGKNEVIHYNRVSENIKYSAKTFVLLSSGDDISELAKRLEVLPCEISVTVGSRLSYDDEKIMRLSLEDALEIKGKRLYIAYIENKTPAKRKLLSYKDDEFFVRNKTPMTKELIRHEVLRRLDLHEGDVFYDIGSGTGSVSIEGASLSDTIKVYSFERKEEALEIQRENMVRSGCIDINIVEGEAPDNFGGIEAPDRVFIGGSGGRLADILSTLKKTDKKIRVVITAVSFETICEIGKLRDDEAVKDLKIRQISYSDVKELGSSHLLMGNNPVVIASFDLS